MSREGVTFQCCVDGHPFGGKAPRAGVGLVHDVSVPSAKDIVAIWSALSQADLADEVSRLVKDRDAHAREVWTAVRGDQVLAAKVRGVLSGLRLQVKGTRDEAMRLVWIGQAQQALARVEQAPPSPPAAVPEPEAPEVEPDVVLRLPSPAAPRTPRAVPAVVFQAPN
jgi:hypothetical protein